GTSEVNISDNSNEDTLLTPTIINEAAATTVHTHIIKSEVPFPTMPPKILAILHEDWDAIDPKGKEMTDKISKIDGAVEFAHARTPFVTHLKGTFGILSAWDQPEEVQRAGLLHTAYSGDLFQFYLYDSNNEDDRNEVKDLLGEQAEALTYLFGTIHRGPLCHFKDVVNNIRPDSVCSTNETHTVAHRGSESGTWDVDRKTAANILIITIADYLDQMVESNGWKHHQSENGGDDLYPGNGIPEVAFYWFTAVCYGIRDHLDVIPSIFNHCQTVISYDDDKQSRDSYWKVITEESHLTEEEQIILLNTSATLNPFIGEPSMLLSQIYYRQKNYLQAAKEARAALEKFYTLASCWDKRRSFGQWVAFSRMMLLRSSRMLEGQGRSIPVKDPHDLNYVNYNKIELSDLRDVIKEMKAREVVQ
ncbi:MAG: hypothetical protein ACI90V_011458, partial [Bacillariaceae sp.]